MLVTAEDVCTRVELELVDVDTGLLARAAEVAAGGQAWAGEAPFSQPVKSWDQVPTLAALTQANLPAGAITSPGLVERPRRHRSSGHTAPWRVVVGLYARGTAASYKTTHGEIRRWAALIRYTVMSSSQLSGFAADLTWVGEEYSELPARGDARTIAGCAVAFDVTVERVLEVPLSGPIPTAAVTTVTVT